MTVLFVSLTIGFIVFKTLSSHLKGKPFSSRLRVICSVTVLFGVSCLLFNSSEAVNLNRDGFELLLRFGLFFLLCDRLLTPMMPWLRKKNKEKDMLDQEEEEGLCQIQ